MPQERVPVNYNKKCVDNFLYFMNSQYAFKAKTRSPTLSNNITLWNEFTDGSPKGRAPSHGKNLR